MCPVPGGAMPEPPQQFMVRLFCNYSWNTQRCYFSFETTFIRKMRLFTQALVIFSHRVFSILNMEQRPLALLVLELGRQWMRLLQLLLQSLLSRGHFHLNTKSFRISSMTSEIDVCWLFRIRSDIVSMSCYCLFLAKCCFDTPSHIFAFHIVIQWIHPGALHSFQVSFLANLFHKIAQILWTVVLPPVSSPKLIIPFLLLSLHLTLISWKWTFYIHLRCLSHDYKFSLQQMKQRLEDIGIKMEVLYDKLRAGQVRVHVAWFKHKVFLLSYSDDSHYFLMQMCIWYHLSNILRSGKEKNDDYRHSI